MQQSSVTLIFPRLKRIMYRFMDCYDSARKRAMTESAFISTLRMWQSKLDPVMHRSIFHLNLEAFRCLHPALGKPMLHAKCHCQSVLAWINVIFCTFDLCFCCFLWLFPGFYLALSLLSVLGQRVCVGVKGWLVHLVSPCC